MAVNSASQFSSDIENYIQNKLLPLARRHLVAYRFGDPLTLPAGRGTGYTAVRYNRIPLPFAPLSEAVPPPGQVMTLSTVSVATQQWGDKITITDVAELTIKHPLFQTGIELMGLQIGETLDRNTFNTLLAGTQVNYVNSRGARASLVAGDVLNVHEINRVQGALVTLGAPRFMGDEQTNIKVDAKGGEPKAGASPRARPHWVWIVHPLVEMDLRENSTIVTAWQYSDVNKLYNDEVGEFGGAHFCRSNMVPTFLGVNATSAGVTATAGTSGNLPTGSYSVIVTASDTQNQYESRIYTTITGVSVTGPNGSIAVVLPALSGFTYNVYVGTTNPPVNLGVSAAGPTTGPLTGQAAQLNPGQTIIITAVGVSQAAPAKPGDGVTVYPSFCFGRGAYGQVVLDNVRTTYLTGADKSDPLNQLRVMGWKAFYATILLNQLFFARVESSSAFSTTFG
jgi:N4-gp56 family major capsid protein